MAYQQNKRVAAIEAKRNTRNPVEDVLIENGMFIQWIAEHGLDIEELKKLPSIFNGIPAKVLQELWDYIEAMDVALTAEDPDWQRKAMLGIE